MSLEFLDQIIDVVKIVLQKRDGSGSTTFYLGSEYMPASQIYSGSPACYPLLATSPRSRRGVGTVTAIRYDVDIKIHGKSAITLLGESFYDLREAYEFQNGDITIYKYAKPQGAATTSTSANTRQVLKIIDVVWEDDVLTLVGRDTDIKDRLISKRLYSEDFDDLDPDYDNEWGAIPFGQDVVIDAPYTSLELGTSHAIEIFQGWQATNEKPGDFEAVAIQNNVPQLMNQGYIEVALPGLSGGGSGAFIGQDLTLYTGTADNLGQKWRMWVYEGSTSYMLDSIRARLRTQGTVDQTVGQLRCDVYLVQESPNFQPIGTSLSTAFFDISSVTSSFAIRNAVFAPVIPIVGGVKYGFVMSWSNADDTTNYVEIERSAPGGVTHYYISRTERDRGWETATGETVGFEIFGYTNNNFGVPTNESAKYQRLAGWQGNLNIGFESPLKFKIRTEGLKDNGSGTYTGSASAIIENPADVIRFLLLDDELGIDHGSGNINTTAFGNVRASLSSAGIKLSFPIDRETRAREVINDICRQARIQRVNDRDGKFSLHFPSALVDRSAVDFTLKQSDLEGEFLIEGVDDNDYSTVINDFEQLHTPDQYDIPKDPALLRRANTDKFSGIQYLNASESSDRDPIRVARMADSEAIYGKRPHTDPLDKLGSGFAASQNYLADRFSALQTRAEIRIPWARYTSADLFSTIEMQHRELPAEHGTTAFLRVQNDGEALSIYNDDQVLNPWSGGTFVGEVVDVYEEGAYYYLTVETRRLL